MNGQSLKDKVTLSMRIADIRQISKGVETLYLFLCLPVTHSPCTASQCGCDPS